MAQDINNNKTEQCNLHVVRRSCLNCKDFTSFRDDYCDDMEPDDEGFCHNGNSKRFGNECAGGEYVCDWHNYA